MSVVVRTGAGRPCIPGRKRPAVVPTTQVYPRYAARANPDAYRDLVVRIGGYTDYFTRLSPEMQDEVMRRTEYGHV